MGLLGLQPVLIVECRPRVYQRVRLMGGLEEQKGVAIQKFGGMVETFSSASSSFCSVIKAGDFSQKKLLLVSFKSSGGVGSRLQQWG